MAHQSKVHDVDRGWKAIQQSIKEVKGGIYAKVGILEAKTERKADQSGAETGAIAGALSPGKASAARVGGALGRAKESADTRLTNAEIGLIQEFGTDDGSIPPRSFLRDVFDGNREVYVRHLVELLKKVFAGEITYEQALNIVALEHERDVKRYFTEAMFPPNAASTVRAKGSSRPLIDTGQLRASITHAIVGGAGGAPGGH